MSRQVSALRLIPPVERAVRESRERQERQRIDEVLRQSDERYRQLFAGNPHPMWVYDVETTRFLDVNDAAIVKYGYSRDRFLWMTLPDIYPEDDHDRLLTALHETQRGFEFPCEWRHKTKSGNILDVEITSSDLRFGDRHARLVLVTNPTEKVLEKPYTAHTLLTALREVIASNSPN